MNHKLFIVLLLIGGIANQWTQAQNISNLNTGAGLYLANNVPAVLTDPNWTVTLLATDPIGQTPPGGFPTGTTYLVPNQGININAPYPTFPFNSWVANDGTSCWLTYADPQNTNGWFTGGDTTRGVYQYQLLFNAPSGGTIDMATWYSDNEGSLYLNGTLVGGPSPSYSYAVPSMVYGLTLNAGLNVVDLIVTNDFGYNQDPTGARVEFVGDVNATAVPEPTSVVLACLGLAGLLTIRRRKA